MGLQKELTSLKMSKQKIMSKCDKKIELEKRVYDFALKDEVDKHEQIVRDLKVTFEKDQERIARDLQASILALKLCTKCRSAIREVFQKANSDSAADADPESKHV